MDNSANVLPPTLNLTGTFEEIINILYFIFERDFILSHPVHDNRLVFITNVVNPDGDGKPEIFWHVISKKDENTGQRLLNYRRAERLPWAKPMIENSLIPGIKIFDYEHGPKDKGIRRYIWLEDHNYVVVLFPKIRTYILLTAYFVDSNSSKRSLNSKYKNRLKAATAG
jgi:hypothetical protein